MVDSLTLKDITGRLGGEIANHDDDARVSRVGSLAYAQTGAISFFSDTKYTAQLNVTKASAVIIKPEHAQLTNLPCIITDNPYVYFAKVSQLLNPDSELKPGIHPTAYISESAVIPASCTIAAHVTIENNVVLGDGVVVGPSTVIERDSMIGNRTLIDANVTIKHESKIGSDCHVFSGAVIGNDGFGYAEEMDKSGIKRWIKIPQIGRVILGDNVDIGANTTVDRGAIDDTVIAEGVKVDNLVQIAHNCRIGAHTVIAGCVGIAGSAIIGEHCKLGGSAMILGHLTIVDNVTISPGTMIMRSITKAGTYTALMPSQEHKTWLKTAANIRQLTQLTDKIKALETQIEHLENLKKI